MAERYIRGTILALGVGSCWLLLLFGGPLVEPAHAAETSGPAAPASRAVPLEARAWRSTASGPHAPGAPQVSTAFVRTGLCASLLSSFAPSLHAGPVESDVHQVSGGEAAHGEGHATQGHAEEGHSDRFHITTVRLWLFRDFVPDGSDPDTLGIEVNSAWGWGCFDVINISYIELADYPQPVPGMPWGNPAPGSGAATGVTDLLSATLFSRKRKHHGPHHFAYGFAFQLPTASDDTLGSGKWSIGPAIEYEYECGRFCAAFVALQLWSVAGDEDRKDVSMLMVKPMITFELSRCWKAVYMPYGISVYWNKPIDDAVYLPLGGGLQYEFQIGKLDMAASVQFFKYVLRSSKGSEHDLRFMLEFDF